jgi:hypothetical protein
MTVVRDAGAGFVAAVDGPRAEPTAPASPRRAVKARAWPRFVLPLVAIGVYARFVRPWQLTWGATSEEVERRLPGDELVPKPMFDATRAITIDAKPDQVWPWLVQVGVTRAGWYSYDLLDNLGRPSAQRVVPELQHLAPGDVVPMSPDGHQGIDVLLMEAPRSMVWSSPGETSWTWQLDPLADGSTRLITRIRSRMRPNPRSIAFYAVVEIADIWMIRRMLLNLKERAERLPAVAGPTS